MSTRLSSLTTLRVGGPVGSYAVADSREDLINRVRAADAGGGPLLVIGGGSNLLAADAPFNGAVVRDGRHEARVLGEGGCAGPAAEDGAPGGVLVRASAGTPWDAFVSWTLDQGLSGLEALSGIPGTVGASPVQNVGAYGHEVAETLDHVLVWDRQEGHEARLSAEDLGFGYRTSVIKRSLSADWGPTGRWVVLDAVFRLERSALSAPVLYGELARRIGARAGERAQARLVREAVLALRAGKGMVLDDADHDTWSAGSFFTNPILSADEADALPAGAPRFPAGDGRVKTSAAWLIDHAGFTKGFALPEAGDPPRASLSTKHVLALTNRGGAAASDIEALARAVRAGVRRAYGVDLVPEPVAVGIAW